MNSIAEKEIGISGASDQHVSYDSTIYKATGRAIINRGDRLMLDYYTVKSLGGNGRKVSIMLAETALQHRVHFLDLERGDQNSDSFRAINPNGRIPALIDPDYDLSLGESGAILVHLAEKTGQFLPSAPKARARVLMWTFWQVGGIGPMLGQWSYFARVAPEKIAFAIERYRSESERLINVLDSALRGEEFIAGEYSIADMALLSWVEPGLAGLRPEDKGQLDFPCAWRWVKAMRARPAVTLAMTKPEGSAVEARDYSDAAQC